LGCRPAAEPQRTVRPPGGASGGGVQMVYS
jgi:hypothetical protein